MASRALILTEGELTVLQDAMNLWRFDHRNKKDTETKRERMYLDGIQEQMAGRYPDERISDLVDIAGKLAFDNMH